jgi:hypothetical protein
MNHSPRTWKEVTTDRDTCCPQCGREFKQGEKMLEIDCKERGAKFKMCSLTCSREDLTEWRKMEREEFHEFMGSI